MEALNKIREGSPRDYKSPFIAVTTAVAVKGTKPGEGSFGEIRDSLPRMPPLVLNETVLISTKTQG